MENCLVTKLKATVNNPNLPVLESMQPFTLDAIAASGNTTNMTDDQKAALNHFFYQIGAIADNSLWNKIKCLALPMICNDNLVKALNNYVDNTENASYGTATFSSHGIVCDSTNVGTTKYTGSSNGLGMVCVPTIDVNYTQGTPASLLGVRDSTNGGLLSKDFGEQSMSFSFQGEGYGHGALSGYSYPFTGISVVSSANDVIFNTYQSGIVETRTFTRSEARADAQLSNKAFCIGGGIPVGIAIIGHGFTNEEVNKLLIYSKELKDNYLGE